MGIFANMKKGYTDEESIRKAYNAVDLSDDDPGDSDLSVSDKYMREEYSDEEDDDEEAAERANKRAKKKGLNIVIVRDHHKAEQNVVQKGDSGFVHTDLGGTRCNTCEYFSGGVCTNKILNDDNRRFKFAEVRNGHAVVDGENDCCNEWEYREHKETPSLEKSNATLETRQKVYKYLRQNYPGSTLAWVRDCTWEFNPKVSLDEITYGRRPGGRDEEKVNGIAEAIKKKKKMEPIILVRTPSGKLKVADGYHRTLAFDHADKKTIPAYVGESPDEHGSWDKEMHDKKLNKAVIVNMKNASLYIKRLIGEFNAEEFAKSIVIPFENGAVVVEPVAPNMARVEGSYDRNVAVVANALAKICIRESGEM